MLVDEASSHLSGYLVGQAALILGSREICAPMIPFVYVSKSAGSFTVGLSEASERMIQEEAPACVHENLDSSLGCGLVSISRCLGDNADGSYSLNVKIWSPHTPDTFSLHWSFVPPGDREFALVGPPILAVNRLCLVPLQYLRFWPAVLKGIRCDERAAAHMEGMLQRDKN